MTPSVTVIVVSYNSGELARRCLESVAADLTGVEWDAIVIDNASPDESGTMLSGMPRTRLIENRDNVGFGAAVNQAARETAAPLVWLLNPDCEVLPGAYAALRETLERHPDCAIAAPQLLNADGSVQASARSEPSASTGLFGRNTLLTRLFPSSTAAKRSLPAQDLVESGVENAPVDWVMGASMLIRAELLKSVDGFDERYFLYWEDADLCRRLRACGFTTRYVPRARVRHPGGASAKSDALLATREFHRSAYRYYMTHVVPSPLHPARWFALAALRLRAWWRGTGLTFRWHAGQVLVDLVSIATCYYAAYRIRFDGDALVTFLPSFTASLPAILGCQLVGLYMSGLYWRLWSTFGLHDLSTVVRGAGSGLVLSVLAVTYVYKFERFSRSVFIIDAVLLVAAIVATRSSFRIMARVAARNSPRKRRVAIYGAGVRGQMLAREMQANPTWERDPVAFVDDDRLKHSQRIVGIPVHGSLDDLERLIARLSVDEVLLSSPAIHGPVEARVRELCGGLEVPVRRLYLEIR